MLRILVTAFEPFAGWNENSSELCLSRLTEINDLGCAITPVVYPVDFPAARRLVQRDIEKNFDFVIHLGQDDSQACLSLEQVALNIGKEPAMDDVTAGDADQSFTLFPDGPLALRSDSALEHWKKMLSDSGVPAVVSYHAGTYLCNAVLYWSLFYTREMRARARPAFVHVPIDTAQAKSKAKPSSGLSVDVSARGVALIIRDLVKTVGVQHTMAS